MGENCAIAVKRYRAGTNLVLLDPDVAEAFPDEKSVNDALRLLMQIAQRQQNNQTRSQQSQSP